MISKLKREFFRITTIVLTVFTLLSFFPQQVFAYDSLSTWQQRFDNNITSMDDAAHYYGYSNSSDSELLAWNGSYILEGLYKMYQLTNDASYIAKMSTYINNMYNNLGDQNSDGYLCWGTYNYGGTYKEFIVHCAMLIAPWAEFILTVKSDPVLAASYNPQGITYSSQADTLESTINNDLIQRWDVQWSTQYNLYLDNNSQGNSLPHNMYLAMARALYIMYQVTPSKSHYLLWADQLVGRFRGYLTSNGSAYDWNYIDRQTSKDVSDQISVREEDYAHASMECSTSIFNYMRGGATSSVDLNKFGNTFYNIWNGSMNDPRVHLYVDGSGPDNDGTNPYLMILSECDLERWKSGIWTVFEKMKSLHWGISGSLEYDAADLISLHPGQSNPQSFDLSYPANGATNISSTATFRWEPSTNAADYTLQISKENSFNTLVYTKSYIISPNAIVSGLSNNTTYYWRVIARNSSGSTNVSGTYSFTTKAATTYTLTFSHYDNRNSGSPQGYHYKQVLINDQVVWESDVCSDEANSWITSSVDITQYCNGINNINVKLRVIEKGPVSNYDVNVYWDDISITDSESHNGDFEKAAVWYYTQNGNAFTGEYNTNIKHTGQQSYRISLPTYTATSTGYFGCIQQVWVLSNPKSYYLSFSHNDNRESSSPTGCHYKQVLIDNQVVWESDVCADAANTWMDTVLDVSEYFTGKSSVNIKLRLYEKYPVSNYDVNTYWDNISLSNTNLQNSGFESAGNWTYSENLAGFNGVYDNSVVRSGTQSYKLYLPTYTQTSVGNNCSISQDVTVQ